MKKQSNKLARCNNCNVTHNWERLFRTRKGGLMCSECLTALRNKGVKMHLRDQLSKEVSHVQA